MNDWWTTPYSGGGPAKPEGFPRPLYPPDSKSQGKNPSVDGPDVVAYKRTLCRLGRWGNWDPDSWDDTFSNNFAHGRGSNVIDSGIAGFQRQQHLDATGWIGEKTFNALRYALVPEGRPNAGQQGMDAEAVRLLNNAWDRFGGAEPAPPAKGTIRQTALDIAIAQIGYAESPAGSNRNKYGAWYGMDGQPWCAMFCTWAFLEAGPSRSFVQGSRYSYCPYVVADARAGHYSLKTTDDPIPGDLVVFDWSADTVYDHIGIFEKSLGGGDFQAVEGNTSTSNNSNGGQVMRRTRNRASQGTVFVRVAE